MTKENRQKHCTQCGSLISEEDKFCGACGKKVSSEYNKLQIQSEDKKIKYETPTKQEKDNFAKISLVLGVLSIFLWEFSIFPILAIVFGGLGISRTIKKRDAGFSTAIWGAVLGIIFLIVRISEL